MSFNDDWDVEQYKVEYESDEHWELRRKFLLTHKDKFPKDQLVCLAQVFVNVELLGCRYPSDTMDLVKDLSDDIAAEYRERKKTKLKRTFVEASEAASSKVKGCTARTSSVTEEQAPNTSNQQISKTANSTNFKKQKKKKTVKNSNMTITTKEMQPQRSTSDDNWKADCVGTKLMKMMGWTGGGLGKSEQGAVEPMSSITKSQRNRKGLGLKADRIDSKNSSKKSFKKSSKKSKLFSGVTEESVSNTANCNYQSCDNSNTQKLPSKRLKTEENDPLNPYGEIILWERPGDNPQNILATSANLSGVNVEWKYTKQQDNWECAIYINTKLASCTNFNKKTAKTEAATIALNKLRKHCYTIKVKQNLEAESNATVITKEMQPSQKSIPDNNLKAECIGSKLMRMMGWTGGGLGKSEQGAVEPVSSMVESQISRKGLGLKGNSSTMREIKVKCQSLFKDYLKTDMQNDIVFLDFTNEERALVHQVARAMGLKSRSKGSTNERKLMVSRKIDIRSLIGELKNTNDGITEKYELVKPADEKYI